MKTIAVEKRAALWDKIMRGLAKRKMGLTERSKDKLFEAAERGLGKSNSPIAELQSEYTSMFPSRAIADTKEWLPMMRAGLQGKEYSKISWPLAGLRREIKRGSDDLRGHTASGLSQSWGRVKRASSLDQQRVEVERFIIKVADSNRSPREKQAIAVLAGKILGRDKEAEFFKGVWNKTFGGGTSGPGKTIGQMRAGANNLVSGGTAGAGAAAAQYGKNYDAREAAQQNLGDKQLANTGSWWKGLGQDAVAPFTAAKGYVGGFARGGHPQAMQQAGQAWNAGSKTRAAGQQGVAAAQQAYNQSKARMNPNQSNPRGQHHSPTPPQSPQSSPTRFAGGH